MEFLLNTYARANLEFVKGNNAILYTSDGREFIDFGSGIGVVSVGHGNRELAEALCRQARTLIHTSNLYRIPPQEQLARRLVELSGIEGGRVFFCNSGAEANETALKIARKYGEVNGEIKRYKVITLRNSFHGRTISTLKATGQPKFHTYFGPFPDGFEYADSIADIYPRLDSKTVAVMVELIQGEGGVNPFDEGEIRELAAELKRRDILLIVDEVQTGVWRTGRFLASQLYQIEPEIVTLAKGLGGGVPIGAVITSLSDIFQPGDHGSTFGGNYLSTTAGLVVTEILERWEKEGHLSHRIELFNSHLRDIMDSYPRLFQQVTGRGLMVGLVASSKQIRDRVVTAGMEEGVLVLKAGEKTVRFLPPLTITPEEIKEGFARLERAVEKVAKGGDS
jgi:acetylornithine aminotransferase